MDGLKAHRGEFEKLLKQLYETVAWFGPPGLTVLLFTSFHQDLWQPVDKGIGYFLKRKFWELLEAELEEDSWAALSASAKRVLVTKLVGEAWRKTRQQSAMILQYVVVNYCSGHSQPLGAFCQPTAQEMNAFIHKGFLKIMANLSH